MFRYFSIIYFELLESMFDKHKNKEILILVAILELSANKAKPIQAIRPTFVVI